MNMFMNTFHFVSLIVLLFCYRSYGQNIDTSRLSKLCNDHYLPYIDKKGKLLGCGYAAECSGMKIIFYEVNLDKTKNRIKIRGKIIEPVIVDDTVGVYSFIFLAQPENNLLHKIRPLTPSYDRLKSDTHEDKFPFQNGDFIIDSEFSSKDRLYFNTPWYRPIEYNIGALISDKIRQ
jgi:hypothetical protein